MASAKKSKTDNDLQSPDPDEKDILTLKGYTKMFEKCENDSDAFLCISENLDETDVDVWISNLSSRNMGKHVAHLYSFWGKYCEKGDLTKKSDYIKFIQVFSLLENVFRNVLLRPYIPAYRTINKNCGRYRSFVTESEDTLFKMLKFEPDDSSNLLTYRGEDPKITIVYAITCSIFWHVLTMKLTTLPTTPSSSSTSGTK